MIRFFHLVAGPLIVLCWVSTPESGGTSHNGPAISNDQLARLEQIQRELAERVKSLETRVSALEQPTPRESASMKEVGSPSAIGVQGTIEVLGDRAYRLRDVGHAYSGTIEGHWIREIIARGRYVLLEDDSLWEVDKADTVTTSLWLRASKIVVATKRVESTVLFELVNVDNDDPERVYVTFRGYAERAR